MALLPTVGGTPFWGLLDPAPMRTWSWDGVAAFFFTVWIYTVVGFVGAFVVSFYYCGSTQMYFLLRKDVDATDYDEIYIERAEDFPAGSEPGGGSSLPVVDAGADKPADDASAANADDQPEK